MSGSQQPAGSGAGPQRSWRPGSSQKTVRSTRKAKLVGASVLLAGLVGLLLWLIFGTSTTPTLTFIGIGRTQYGRSLPLNPGAERDVDALNQLLKALHQLVPAEVAAPVDTSDYLYAATPGKDDGLLKHVQEICKGQASQYGESQTLVVFCSLHSQVQSNAEEPPGLRLLVDSGGSVSLPELITTLKTSPAKQVVLLLDVATGPAWTQGMLGTTGLIEQITRDTQEVKSRIAVIVATSGIEHSWATPAESKDSKSQLTIQPGTVFGKAIHNALASPAADTNGNHVLELAEFFDAVKKESASWNQTVQWLNRSKKAANVQLTTLPSLPEVEDDTDDKKLADTKTPDESAKAPAGKKKPKQPTINLEDRLNELWKTRDAIWLSNPDNTNQTPERLGEQISGYPLSWRDFNYELVSLEEALRYELHTQPNYKDDIHKRFDRVEAQAKQFDAANKVTIDLLPSAAWVPAPTKQQAAAFSATLKILLAEQGPAEPPAPALDEPTPLTTAPQRMAFAGWLVDNLASSVPADVGVQVEQINSALKSLGDRRGIYWQPEQWPVELLLLSRIAAAFPAGSIDRESALAIQRTVIACRKSNRMGGLLSGDSLRPEIHEHVQDLIDTNISSVLAAERWLLAGQNKRANDWLTRAEASLTDAIAQAQAIRGLLQIREMLLAEYSDHAQWIASRLEFDGTPFDAAIATGRSPEAAALNSIREDIGKIDALLLGNEPLGGRKVDTLRASATEGLQKFSKGLDAFCAGLSDNARWSEIDYTLRTPWIRAATRQRLAQSFKNRKPGQKAPKGTDGAWQEFWCASTLSLALPEIDTSSSPKRERTKNGQALGQKWTQLNTMMSRPDTDPVRFDRYARLSTAFGQANDFETRLRQQRDALQRSLRTKVAKAWMRRGGQDREAALRVSDSILDNRQLGKATDPVLTGLPTTLRSESEKPSPLTISWEPAAPDQQLDVMIIGNNVTWADQEAAVRTVSHGEQVPLRLTGRAAQQFQLALLKPDTRNAPEPYNIRTLTMSPELSAAGWSLAFALPGSDGTKTLPATEGQRVVWVNPNTATPAELRLKRPSGRPAEALTVTLCISSNGKAVPKFVGEAKFEKGKTEAILAVAPADGTTPDAPVDISRGLICKVRSATDAGQQFTINIQPWTPSALSFVEKPTCNVSEDTITVSVKRKANAPSLPDQFEFTVEPGQRLRGVLEDGKPRARKLTRNFAETAVAFKVKKGIDSLRGYELALSVAGVPHAFRWRLGATGPQTLLSETGRDRLTGKPSLRFGSLDRLFVAKDENVPPIRVETYFPHDDFLSLKGATLELFLQQTGRPPNLLDWWSNVRGPERFATLQMKDGLVVLNTTMKDYEFAAKALAQNMQSDGQYELVAKLTQNNVELDKRSVKFGIDRTDPIVKWIQVPAAVNGDWKLTQDPGMGRVLELRASIVEPHSRIIRYTLKVLKDDAAVISQDLTRSSTGEIMTIKIPKGLLPKESGTYEFVLEVENEAGRTAENSNKKKITINKPIPAPPKPASGDGGTKDK